MCCDIKGSLPKENVVGFPSIEFDDILSMYATIQEVDVENNTKFRPKKNQY